MFVCVRKREKERERAHELRMCFWCTAIFFPPAASSKDVTTRLHAVPSISPPSLPHPSSSSLPYLPLPPLHAHSPVLRRPQPEKARHCSTVEALRPPPLLVRCHTTQSPLSLSLSRSLSPSLPPSTPILPKIVTAPHAGTLMLPGERTPDKVSVHVQE